MLIKVCGLKYESNIRLVLELKPHFIGFNFYPHSPRFFNEAFDLNKIEFGNTKRAGVFVNEATEIILETAERFNLDVIQLHGNESMEQAMTIKKHYPVIKAIGVESKEDLKKALEFEGCADYILLDRKSVLFGGTGTPFDWKLIENYSSSVPFILGGGLSPVNIRQAKAIQHPKFAGVDLNSSFEDSPGVKNIEKLKSAFAL